MHLHSDLWYPAESFYMKTEIDHLNEIVSFGLGNLAWIFVECTCTLQTPDCVHICTDNKIDRGLPYTYVEINTKYGLKRFHLKSQSFKNQFEHVPSRVNFVHLDTFDECFNWVLWKTKGFYSTCLVCFHVEQLPTYCTIRIHWSPTSARVLYKCSIFIPSAICFKWKKLILDFIPVCFPYKAAVTVTVWIIFLCDILFIYVLRMKFRWHSWVKNCSKRTYLETRQYERIYKLFKI